MDFLRPILLLGAFLMLKTVVMAQDGEHVFIGQNVDSLQRIVALEVQGHYNAGGYLVKMSAHTIDYKGKPVTIILCKENVLNPSVNKGINLCVNYFIAKDTVSYVSTEYKNLSKIEVKGILLSDRRLTNVAGYYFESNYRFYHRLIMNPGGSVVDEYRETVFEQLPLSVREQLGVLLRKY